MTKSIIYVERLSKEKKEEKIYGKKILRVLYPQNQFLQFLIFPIVNIIVRLPLFSWLFGLLQKAKRSRKKIARFIKAFEVNLDDFDPIQSYSSFNDFFTRKLKPNSRSINSDPKTAILPADGRYQFFQNLAVDDQFFVKDKAFNLETFLQSSKLALQFSQGTLVLCRLAPMDYHRFHFPIDGFASNARLIKGPLFSVNPIALRKKLTVLMENKRMITKIKSHYFDEVLFIEIGATNVGSIHQTYRSDSLVKKGDEKGYFSFGASAIALLFKPGCIKIDSDLTELSQTCEVYAKFGQSLGIAR